MASPLRTTDHEQIRSWVEERGAIPTTFEGTEGLLRIDFVRGSRSGGREPWLREVDWDSWFELFEQNRLAFICSPVPISPLAAERKRGG
jgi:hypothetical protein